MIVANVVPRPPRSSSNLLNLRIGYVSVRSKKTLPGSRVWYCIHYKLKYKQAHTANPTIRLGAGRTLASRAQRDRKLISGTRTVRRDLLGLTSPHLCVRPGDSRLSVSRFFDMAARPTTYVLS